MSGRISPARLTAYGVVGVRAAVAAGFAVRPRPTMATVYGTTDPRLRPVAWGIAARDAALGYGLLRALRKGRGAGRWMLAGTVADAFDLVTVVATVPKRTTGNVRSVAAMCAIVTIDSVLSRRLDR